jgi:kinesin family protein C2/C3
LKKILKSDAGSFSKHEFIVATSQYLNQRTTLVSSDLSRFCVCGGKPNGTRHNVNLSADHAEVIDFQQKQLEV